MVLVFICDYVIIGFVILQMRLIRKYIKWTILRVCKKKTCLQTCHEKNTFANLRFLQMHANRPVQSMHLRNNTPAYVTICKCEKWRVINVDEFAYCKFVYRVCKPKTRVCKLVVSQTQFPRRATALAATFAYFFCLQKKETRLQTTAGLQTYANIYSIPTPHHNTGTSTVYL